VSAAQPGAPVSAAYRVSGPVPALFHEDPLFLELCAAFDDLLSPVVTALDCFAATWTRTWPRRTSWPGSGPWLAQSPTPLPAPGPAPLLAPGPTTGDRSGRS
jgi:hypothetical protein